MNSTLRVLTTLLIIAAGIAAVVWGFLPEPLSVDVATCGRGPLLVTVNEDGKTRIRERYIVSTPLAGRLLRIELDPGDGVDARKTLLAMIEPRDPDLLDPRAVAQAEARVQTAEAALDKIGPLIEQAKQTQAFSENDLARARKLHAKNAIGKEDFEETLLRFRHAAEGIRSARIAEEIAKFELQQAKAALIRSRPRDDAEADNDLEGNSDKQSGDVTDWDFPIHAPISGRVLRVFQESASVVNAGTPLLELGDPSDLEVVVDVLSQDAVGVEPGDRVVLEHWAIERPALEGRVRLVEPAAFTKISTLGVEEQRVNVVIDLVDPPDKRQTLGDGFRVEARIVTWESDDVLKVPTSALFRHGDDWAAFVVEEDRAKRTTVHLGRRNGLDAEVTDGLAEGAHVIVHPSDSVRDGVRVEER